MASDTDNGITIDIAGSNDAHIVTHYQTAGGPTGHIQIVGIGYEKVAGASYAIASETSGLPVRIPAASTVGGYVQDIHGCLTGDGSAGNTAIGVDIISSAGLTINAIVEDLIVGITTDLARAQIGVYGTGGTAVGVTGSVYVLGTTDVKSTSGITVYGSGGGAVNVDGIVGITTNAVYSSLYVQGTGPHGTGGAVGVTGTVLVDDSSLIGISGGVVVTSITTPIPVKLPTGLTNGSIESGLNSGLTLGAHGLSSGVRIQAFATGSSAEYVYVGASAAGIAYTGASGLTHRGFALREMDTVFLEVDNTGKVAIVSDNSAAKIRYIGS